MLTRKQLNRKIDGICKRDGTIADDIQTVLVNEAGHAFQHLDVTGFTRLFQGLRGADRTALVKWVHEHGFARLDKETGGFKLNRAARNKCALSTGDEVVADLIENAPHWTAHSPAAEKIVDALSVTTMIEALAKRIVNAEKPDAKRKLGEIDTRATREALDKLYGVVAAISNERKAFAAEVERGETLAEVNKELTAEEREADEAIQIAA